MLKDSKRPYMVSCAWSEKKYNSSVQYQGGGRDLHTSHRALRANYIINFEATRDQRI